jgi:predicted GNAT family acetyltransferase
MSDEPRIALDEAAGRYELFVAGELAGYAEYELRDGGITFVHTVVDDAFEGRGLGSRLVRAALDDARELGLRVTPRCSFFRIYIERHPEYHDLLDAA